MTDWRDRPDPHEVDPEDADVDEPLDGEWPDESEWASRPLSDEERQQARRERERRRHRWQYLPDEPVPEVCRVEVGALGSFARALRWRAGLSQREFAERAAVPAVTITRLERDASVDPRLSSLQRMVEACGLRLAVVDEEGTQLTIPFGQDRFRDAGDRMLPAHLPTYDPRGRGWWGHGLVGGPDPRHPEPPRVHARRERRPRPRTGPQTTLSDVSMPDVPLTPPAFPADRDEEQERSA